MIICITSLLVINSWLPLAHTGTVTVFNKADDPANASSLSNDCIHSLKLEHLDHALKQIDGAVQSLQEKAHNWAIFRHHIDAWNDQIKSLEHKLDLVKRTQDEQQIYGSKLISMEFTLNHILSKVIYLSDACITPSHDTETDSADTIQTKSTRSSDIFDAHLTNIQSNNGYGNGNGRGTVQQQQKQQQGQERQQQQEKKQQSDKQMGDPSKLLNEQIALLGDIKQMISLDTGLRHERSTLLRNIMRHVQNIERDNCRAPEIPHKKNNGCSKFESCNSNQNTERALKTLIDHQISKLEARSVEIPTDLKQLPTLAKKNSQQLTKVVDWMKKIDKRLLQWNDELEHGCHQCQAIASEISTFTESSDLLLKRIELLVNDVYENLSKDPTTTNKTVTSKDQEENTEDEKDEHIANNTDISHLKSSSEKIGGGEQEKPSDSDEDIDSSTDVDAEGTTPKNDDHLPIEGVLQSDKLECHELDGPSIDGVYKFSTPEINEAGRDFNERYCAFATEGAPWTVIQNRGPYANHENFNRSWVEYKNGFGDLNKEFWFGNEFVHRLVDRDDYELRIELADFENERVWAEYSFFRLDNEQYNYNLLIGGYNGTAPDAMHYHNEMDFSTYDRRNDRSVDACCACAIGYGSGWWFDNCSEANLNGIYRTTPSGHNYVGIIWEQWRGDYSLKQARMLMRPMKEDGRRNEHHEDP